MLDGYIVSANYAQGQLGPDILMLIKQFALQYRGATVVFGCGIGSEEFFIPKKWQT